MGNDTCDQAKIKHTFVISRDVQLHEQLLRSKDLLAH